MTLNARLRLGLSPEGVGAAASALEQVLARLGSSMPWPSAEGSRSLQAGPTAVVGKKYGRAESVAVGRLQETLKRLAFFSPYPFPPASLLAASPAATPGDTRGRSCWASAWIVGSPILQELGLGNSSGLSCGAGRGWPRCLLTRFRPSEMLMMASISSSICKAQD